MKHFRRRMGTVGKVSSRRGSPPGCRSADATEWADHRVVSCPTPAKEVVTMIIDTLTITGILTFVIITAFLILSTRNAVKHGDLRTRTGTPGCKQFCD